MKHKLKITAILLGMFLLTQFIGLFVQYADIFHIKQEINGTIQEVSNPHLLWIQPPEAQEQSQYNSFFVSIVIAFIIAILIMFFLSKLKIEFILRLWFFVVVVIALFISFYAFEKLSFSSVTKNIFLFLPFLIALPLAYIKIYKQNFLLHNFTELLIYPGIAAVFVPLLNLYTIIALLILISIYDMWAVWHSGFMQKMAQYQIKKLNVFSGFFIPYASKAVKEKIKKMKMTLSKSQLAKKKIRINVAILGGGDVIFPIITAGVMLKLFTFYHALFVIAGATLGLGYLLVRSEKKKFYPAMPFITVGIFIGMILGYLLM